MNVKFHKNCENTSKSLKISCERCKQKGMQFVLNFSGTRFLSSEN